MNRYYYTRRCYGCYLSILSAKRKQKSSYTYLVSVMQHFLRFIFLFRMETHTFALYTFTLPVDINWELEEKKNWTKMHKIHNHKCMLCFMVFYSIWIYYRRCPLSSIVWLFTLNKSQLNRQLSYCCKITVNCSPIQRNFLRFVFWFILYCKFLPRHCFSFVCLSNCIVTWTRSVVLSQQ